MQHVILGIDPGSRRTGYGVVSMTGPRLEYVGSGCIYAGESSDPLPERLRTIYDGINELFTYFKPNAFAVEMTFVATNVQATIKLSEARAIALLVGAQHEIEVAEYTPMQIKQAVTSYGLAQKQQVQSMVQHLLNLSDVPQADAADALACAICHGHSLRARTIYAVDQKVKVNSGRALNARGSKAQRSFRHYNFANKRIISSS